MGGTRGRCRFGTGRHWRYGRRRRRSWQRWRSLIGQRVKRNQPRTTHHATQRDPLRERRREREHRELALHSARSARSERGAVAERRASSRAVRRCSVADCSACSGRSGSTRRAGHSACDSEAGQCVGQRRGARLFGLSRVQHSFDRLGGSLLGPALELGHGTCRDRAPRAEGVAPRSSRARSWPRSLPPRATRPHRAAARAHPAALPSRPRGAAPPQPETPRHPGTAQGPDTCLHALGLLRNP